jgi:hypothetical protein
VRAMLDAHPWVRCGEETRLLSSLLSVSARIYHGLINFIDTKAKMLSSKKIDRDFAAGIYQILKTGDTVSHVGIFDPAL